MRSLALRCQGLVDGDVEPMIEAVAFARQAPLLVEHAGSCEDAARLLAFHLGQRFGSNGHAHLATAQGRLLEAARTGEFPIVAGTESWSVAASFTTGGAWRITKERPATWNMGTSLSQSPTTTTSARVQPWWRASHATAVPLVWPAARTTIANMPMRWTGKEITCATSRSRASSSAEAARMSASGATATTAERPRSCSQ